MARAKFLCDAERCIECNACVTACKNEHEVPWGINRRRVVTIIKDGNPGERSISVACMHCSDAPCMAVCPVDCFYQTDDGMVLHSKDLCIGCGYCFYACPVRRAAVPAGRQLRIPRQDGQVHLLRRRPGRGHVHGRVPEVRPQPDRRGQTPDLCRDVLHQGPPRGQRRRRLRHLSANASWPAASGRAPGAGARPTTRKVSRAAIPEDNEASRTRRDAAKSDVPGVMAPITPQKKETAAEAAAQSVIVIASPIHVFGGSLLLATSFYQMICVCENDFSQHG